MSLSKVSQQARNFVIDNPSEFLLPRFDKYKNYPLIAEACIEFLGPYIHQNFGNLNTKTLFELAGSVIPMVPKKAAKSLAYNFGHGIHAWCNLRGEDDPGAGYNPQFNGLQYFGGGGTNPLKGGSTDDKISEKETTRKKKMTKMASCAANTPEVLGMMYWTTTGLFTNIEGRNNRQWEPQNRTRLAQL